MPNPKRATTNGMDRQPWILVRAHNEAEAHENARAELRRQGFGRVRVTDVWLDADGTYCCYWSIPNA